MQLRKRGKYYHVIFSVTTSTGKTKRKEITTGETNKKKAELKAAKIIVSNGGKIDNDSINIIDYLQKTRKDLTDNVGLEGYPRNDTIDSYCHYIDKQLIPYFENNPCTIQSFNNKNAKELFYYLRSNGSIKSNRQKGISRESVKKVFAPLNRMFNIAIEDGIVDINVARNYKLPKSTATKYSAYALDKQSLLKLYKDTENEKMYSVILLTSHFALRRSEIAGLRWGAVDFPNRQLSISDTRVRTSGGEHFNQGKTKSTSSKRTFSLNEFMYNYLWKMYLNTFYADTDEGTKEKMKKVVDSSHEKTFVFTNPKTHKAYSVDWFSKGFRKVVNKYGYDSRLTLHGLRHTTASLLINENITPPELAKYLGHESTRTTAIYTHVVSDAMKKSSETMESMFGTNTKNEES